MNQIEIGVILIGMTIVLVGVPILCVCCKCNPSTDSLKPLGKYLLK